MTSVATSLRGLIGRARKDDRGIGSRSVAWPVGSFVCTPARSARRPHRRRVPVGAGRGLLERAPEPVVAQWLAGVDYPEVPPDPPPFTTIVWRMLHVSDGNSIYWEHSFGPGVRNFWDLAPRGEAVAAMSTSSRASALSPPPLPRWMTGGWTRCGPRVTGPKRC